MPGLDHVLGRETLRIKAFRLLQQRSPSVARRQRIKSGSTAWGIEIPGILGQTDEIADPRIGRPSSTKRRTRQILGNIGSQKGPDVGCSTNRFDWRQARRIESSFGCGTLTKFLNGLCWAGCRAMQSAGENGRRKFLS